MTLPTPLLALTLAQPWPRMMLLPEGPKRLENRVWTPPRKLIGQYIALHGGRLPKSAADFEEIRGALDWVNMAVWDYAEDPDDWRDTSDILKLCVSGIYAVARIARIVTGSDDPWRTNDPYGWILEDFTAIEPVRCGGAQKLWEVQGDLRAAVVAAWEKARGQAAPAAAPASEPPPWIAAGPIELPDPPRPSPALSTPAPARRSTSRLDPYPQPDPGAQLRLPGLFCPGRAVAALPASPEPGRLYGLPVGQDWVTVRLDADAYHWASRRTAETGQGSRREFDTWVAALTQGRAA